MFTLIILLYALYIYIIKSKLYFDIYWKRKF